MANRKLVVEIVGDTSNLEKSFKRANRETDRFGRQMNQTTRGAIAGSLAFKGLGRSVAFAAAPFLAGAGLVAGLKAASSEASNLAEQTTKSQAVFGAATKTVQDFAKNALGLANSEALEITGTFGALLRPMGFVEKASAATSIQLTKLGVDLASFSNTSVPDALDAIRSGLVGESEPLRKYGVQLSEVRVQQEAMAATGKKSAKQLTNQEKTTARLAIIMRDTSLAQGDFARTSGGLANQQRILAANLKNLSAEIGTVLNPVILDATKKLNKFLANPENRKQIVDGLTSVVNGLGTAFRFAADGANILRVAWDKLPDFGKDQGLVDLFRKLPGLEKGSRQLGADLFVIADALGLIADNASTANLGLRNLVGPIGLKIGEPASGLTGPIGTPGIEQVADTSTKRGGITQSQRNTFFDNMIGRLLDRVQDVKSLQGQVGALGKIATLIRQRLAIQKDITRQNRLEDQLLDISRQQRGIEAQIAANKADAHRLRLERERERIAKQRAQVVARIAAQKSRQFRALGLTGGGDEIVAGQRLLKAQLGRVSEAVSGTFLDTSKTRSVLAHVRKVLAGGLGAVGRDVRSQVKSILDGINDQLKNHEGNQTKFRKTNFRSILAASGLDPEQVKRVSFALSRVGAGGTVATAGGAFVVHTTVNLDGKKVATSTTKHQQKARRRNPQQKRGPFAGGRVQ